MPGLGSFPANFWEPFRGGVRFLCI